MGTNAYFEDQVIGADDGKIVRAEVGTTTYAGDGPKLYLKLGDSEVIMSHTDAKLFCEAIFEISKYLGYSR